MTNLSNHKLWWCQVVQLIALLCSFLWILSGLQIRRKSPTYHRQTNQFSVSDKRWSVSHKGIQVGNMWQVYCCVCSVSPPIRWFLQQYWFPLISKYYKQHVFIYLYLMKERERQTETEALIWVIWRLLTRDDQFGTTDTPRHAILSDRPRHRARPLRTCYSMPNMSSPSVIWILCKYFLKLTKLLHRLVTTLSSSWKFPASSLSPLSSDICFRPPSIMDYLYKGRFSI